MIRQWCIGVWMVCSMVYAVPPSELVNEKNPDIRWPLKWATQVGLTTFRTTIHHVNQQIIVGSNGRSYSSLSDSVDGVYFLDSKTGKERHHIRFSSPGDHDVNGVAVTSQRIFFGSDHHELICCRWDGELLWQSQLDADIEGAPALEDFNTDGVLDVCVGTESGQLFAVNGLDGSVLWQFQASFKPHWTYPETRGFIASPALKDVNADGVRDVLIGNRNGDFYAFNGKTGEILWSFRTQKPSGIHSSAVVASKNILATESYGRVYSFSQKGRIRYQLPVTPEDLPIIKGNAMESPSGTVIVPTAWPGAQGGIWLYPRRTKPVFIPLGKMSASPVIADFLGTGTQQIGVLSENGWFVVLSEIGEVLAKFSLGHGGEATPLVTDVDGNGTLDLILATKDRFLSCYDTGSRGAVYWGSFRGNPYNTGVVQDVIDADFPEEGPDIFDVPDRRVAGYQYYPLYHYTFENNTYQIGEYGIGPVRLGISVGKLMKVLGKDVQYNDVHLGLGMKARAIIWKGEVHCYILYPAWKVLEKSDVVNILGTNHPRYRTKEGIGPSSQISDAAKVYGIPTLTYRLEDALEERIHFKQLPSNIWFANYGKAKKGYYKKEKSFNVTRRYQEGATVGFVGVKR